MRLRRPLLFSAVAGMAALVARRAHANRDPSELSVGGGVGEHDAHLSCGPDVRVRHASAGFAYQRVFQAAERDPGEGVAMDLRGGVGTTTITEVHGTGAQAAALANEVGKSHTLMTVQALAGFDWGKVAFMGGIGYFGLATTKDNHSSFDTRFVPLPALDVRVGARRTGFSADFGLGAPPVAGLTRWYSLYGIGQFRFKEGGEVGAGVLVVPAGEVDARKGVLFKGAIPITDWMTVGGFGVLNVDAESALTGFNWTAGGQVSFVLDAME